MNKLITKTIGVTLVVFTSTSFMPTTALAGNAKGKPFVALEGKIVEVQGAISTLEDQVSELIGQVNTIEARLVANEQAISDLNVENEALNILIAGAYTSLDDINLEISALSVNFDTNAGLISTLQSTVASIEAGQIDLAENLQDQIDNNMSLIGVLEDNIVAINKYMSMDQHITEGTCPDGLYVVGHTADSLSCASVDGGGSSSTISGYYKYARSKAYEREMKVYCNHPADIRTGGGFDAISFSHTVKRSSPEGANGWTVGLSGNSRDVQAYVVCLRVN